MEKSPDLDVTLTLIDHYQLSIRPPRAEHGNCGEEEVPFNRKRSLTPVVRDL